MHQPQPPRLADWLRNAGRLGDQIRVPNSAYPRCKRSSLGQPLSMGSRETGHMNIKEFSLKVVRIQPLSDQVKLPARHADDRHPQSPVGRRITTSRICICCGEPMVERGDALSRNPNVCASCSSLADGMEEASRSIAAQVGERMRHSPSRDDLSFQRKPNKIVDTTKISMNVLV